MTSSIVSCAYWPSIYRYRYRYRWNVFSNTLSIFKLDYFIFLWLNSKDSYASQTLISYQIYDLYIRFFVFYSLSFHFPDTALWYIKVFDFDKFNLSIFSIFACTFAVTSKKPLAISKSRRFTPIFSPMSFIVFFKLFYFKLICTFCMK